MSPAPKDIFLYRKQSKSSHRNRLQRIGIVSSSFLSLLGVILIVGAAWLYSDLTRDLPPLEQLPLLLEPPDGILLGPTRLYDSTGEHIIRTLKDSSSSGRQYLALPPELWKDHSWQVSSPNRPEVQAYLPAEIVDAILATVEPSFWSSLGFNISGLSDNASPSLAQRLVRDLLLADEPAGLRRNFRESLLAAQLISTYGRAKVLEWYLNIAKFGPLVYGTSDAAQVYLGKSAEALNLAEAAILAAAHQSPTINLLYATEITLEKQKEILTHMYTSGTISQRELNQALTFRITFRSPEIGEVDPFFPFTELVMEELIEKLGADKLERGGLDIITSLDYDLQLQASCAASTQIVRMEEPRADDSPTTPSDCQAARLLPTLAMEDRVSPGTLSANVLMLDPHNGHVLALSGDTDSNLNRLHQAAYEPGSLVTPFIYLTSFTRGMGPASLVWDIPFSENDLQPTHANQIFHGPVSLRTAIANDYLNPAVQVLGQVGPDSVWRITREFGLTSISLNDLNEMLQSMLLLSSGKVSLTEIGLAYSVFANQGVLAGQAAPQLPGSNGLAPLQPISVLSVKDRKGNTWMNCLDPLINCIPQDRPIVSPQLAYLVTDLLSDEPSRWPSLGHPNALEIGRPAGAKIGLVGSKAQAWTVGFTPQVTAVVWLGDTSLQEMLPPGQITSKAAAGLWHAVIQYASRDLTPEGWSAPDGIIRVETCYPSGLLPTVNCPTVAIEVFINGNEPTSFDNLYRIFQVNRETGRLATIFTPSELVEERVYLVVPPNAIEWAKAAGLPTPPDAYDAITAQTTLTDVRIDSPEMFSHLSGSVNIMGTAAGPDFDFYRVQVGKGLNPREWIQIGDPKHTPVVSDVLAEWDLNGLSGLYAVQLQVVRTDQRIETSIIQVTVDNQKPEVTILHPSQGQRFITSEENNIILQVEAWDDIALQKVEFYMNGQLLASLRQPPFTLSWTPSPGQHAFLVKTVDQANNIREETISFSVSQ